MHLEHSNALRRAARIVLCLALAPAPALALAAPQQLADRTLVVWCAPADLAQRAGSAIAIDDEAGRFDAIVFGELEPRRWMAGSEGFRRTQREQAGYAEETASPSTFLQLALVQRGREVELWRDGVLYARHEAVEAPPSYGPACSVLFGRRHLDAADPQHSFTGRIREARIYAEALSGAALAALRAGTPDAERAPWAWWDFAGEGLREKTGRFRAIELVGDARVADGCLVLGGAGATVIQRASGDESRNAVAVPRSWSATEPVPDSVLLSTRLLRERLLADPHRPRWHFCLPEDIGIPGDPNGAFYRDGRYHLMYLYERRGAGFWWGHVSSADLDHWRHHPDAIGPGDGDDGCFSGGGFVDDDGTAYLSYWMLWGAKGIGLASSRDLERWQKSAANPVIRSTAFGLTETRDLQGQPLLLGSADPSNVWKQDGLYHVLTGNLLVLDRIGRAADAPPETQGDRLYLWTSPDLVHWSYRHVFYERRVEWTDRSEDNMCPTFLPLPSSRAGGPPSGKHLLSFISHNKGCQYYVGTYRDLRFLPEQHGRMTWVDNTFFAPEALIDGRGRQLLWAWLLDNPQGERARGWSGVYGLPRTLWLGEDGTLRQAPVEELEQLRGERRARTAVALRDGADEPIEGVDGTSCELALEIAADHADRVALAVRASPEGAEETLLYYDARAGELVFDSTRSGGDGRRAIERAPFALAPGEPLRLRVFVDRSVVELFANDRQAITRRVYPTRADSTGLFLRTRGGAATVRSVEAWELAPANPY